eukprot:1145413-Pelagomonas_calceolata.AAC.13
MLVGEWSDTECLETGGSSCGNNQKYLVKLPLKSRKHDLTCGLLDLKNADAIQAAEQHAEDQRFQGSLYEGCVHPVFVRACVCVCVCARARKHLLMGSLYLVEMMLMPALPAKAVQKKKKKKRSYAGSRITMDQGNEDIQGRGTLYPFKPQEEDSGSEEDDMIGAAKGGGQQGLPEQQPADGSSIPGGRRSMVAGGNVVASAATHDRLSMGEGQGRNAIQQQRQKHKAKRRGNTAPKISEL